MVNPSVFRVLLVLLVVGTANLALWCHPHVFIDSTLRFAGNGNSMDSIQVQWRFDEVYSASFFQDFKIPASKVYQGKELARVKREAFDNIAEFGYFADLRIDGKAMPIKKVRDFAARVDRGWLIYSFTIDLSQTAKPGSQIELSFFDSEYFIAFYEFDPKQVSQDKLPEGSQTRIGSKTVEVKAWGKVQISTVNLQLGKAP